MLSRRAEEEIVALARSESFRRDGDILSAASAMPFGAGEAVDVDAFTDFVAAFNEFINHRPKPFRRINDKDMRL